MRTAVLGLLVVAGLVMALAGAVPGQAIFAQRTSPTGPGSPEGELIALSTVVGDKYQQVTVIDPKQRVMSVYHVDLATGDVELRCVRNIHWDLQMMYFNGKSPLPQEILSMIQSK